ALVVLGGWALTAAAVFSYASGIVHTYYVSALAPAVAGLAGVAAVALWRTARRGGLWIAPALVAVPATAALAGVLPQRSGYPPWLQWLVLAGALVAATIVAAARSELAVKAALAAGIGVFLVAPAAWAETTLEAPVNGVFPGAGPNFVSGLVA